MMIEGTGKKLQGRHVLFMLLGFFGVMFLVNGIFTYFALTSFSGLSVPDAYMRGIHYNREIASARAQDARGWRTDLTFEAAGELSGLVRIRVSDRNGLPVTGLTASLSAQRPVREGDDVTLPMIVSHDGFERTVTLAGPGQWDLVIMVTGGEYDAPYRVEKRIWVN
jgi:nitrogen fixation protein FixH